MPWLAGDYQGGLEEFHDLGGESRRKHDKGMMRTIETDLPIGECVFVFRSLFTLGSKYWAKGRSVGFRVGVEGGVGWVPGSHNRSVSTEGEKRAGFNDLQDGCRWCSDI